MQTFITTTTTLSLIPNCTCDGTPESIILSNFILIIVILPILALSGFIFNIISLIIFVKQCIVFNSAPCVYLVALAISDCGVCLSGLMVMSVDSFRTYSPIINYFWSPMIPKLVPIAVIFQMCSVYITVFAALDCYFSVAVFKVKDWWCQPNFAKRLVLCSILTIFAYNFISFFELHYSECFDIIDRRIRYEICATSFRSDFYVRFYKGYMYLATMAALPCILLVGLCLGIFKNMQRKSWSDVFQADANNRFLLQNTLIRGNYSMQTLLEKSRSRDQKSGSSPLMLVVVIILFLLCNSVSLIVNCLEILTGDTFAELNLMLIDIGNVLVVFNAWANFFVYILLSQSYRSNLQTLFCKCPVIFSPSPTSKAECINAV